MKLWQVETTSIHQAIWDRTTCKIQIKMELMQGMRCGWNCTIGESYHGLTKNRWEMGTWALLTVDPTTTQYPPPCKAEASWDQLSFWCWLHWPLWYHLPMVSFAIILLHDFISPITSFQLQPSLSSSSFL